MKASVVFRSLAILLLGLVSLVGFATASHAFGTEGGGDGGGDGPPGGVDIPAPECQPNCTPPPGGDGGGDGDDGNGNDDPQYKWINQTTRIDFRDPPKDTWSQAVILPYAKGHCFSGNHVGNVIGADVEYSRLYSVDTDSFVEGDSGFKQGSVTCIELDITRTNHVCVIKVELSITQTAGVGVPPQATLAEKTVTSGGWRTGQTVKQCENSSVYGKINRDIKEMGRYRADAVVHYRNIVAINTYDPILKEKTVEIEERGDYTRRNTMYAQKTCEAGAAGLRTGADRDRVFRGSGWSWTHADCGPDTTPEPQRYECVAADSSVPGRAVNGTARNRATLFRDGNANELTWGILRPSSPFQRDGGSSTRFYRNEDGTPWKETKSDPLLSLNISKNKANNRFASKETRTSWLSGGPHSTAYVRGYWASTDGKPTYINPVWRYEGTMPLRVAERLEFNTETNEWSVAEWRTERVPSTATCEGPKIRLTFVRATSTN